MIHKFYRAGNYIVLDIGSGAVHVVDEITYFLLDFVTPESLKEKKLPIEALVLQFAQSAIESAFAEICSLYESEQLYSSDDYSAFIGQTGLAPVKAICLNIAHDCNLRCSYCFASTGDFGKGRKLMPFETAKKAMDLLIELSGTRHNLEVDFFGGEPLMNFDVVKQTVEYCRSIEKEKNKNFRFTITTNGVLLTDEISEYINKEMHNVVLSIDGRKEVNDRLRKRVDKKGSYDTILPRYQKLVSGRGDKEYYVRGTYTKHNLDFDADILHLNEQGFDQISVEPVVGPDEDEYAILTQHMSAIEDTYTRLMDTMIARKKTHTNFNFFHFMIDLNQGPCAIKRLRGCGCGNEYVAVTPEGEIYPCHQFVGQEEFIMGTVDTGLTNLAMKEQFSKANIYTKMDCGNCWAKYYCSGGCNANNYTFHHDILKPHTLSCDLEKMRLECAIALKAATL